ncbi:MAG: hypothetical protein AABM67_04450 [Acidobacteriota bacterium]
MSIQTRRWPVLAGLVMLFSISTLAQTPDRPPPESTRTQESAANAVSLDKVANEIALLRKSVQTLNVRLGEISVRASESNSNQSGPGSSQKNIGVNLELLTRAEQRADMLRKQLVEVIEKETSLKIRLVQLEEEMRPENIERSLNVIGGTRTAELREARRRVLSNERKAVEELLGQTLQGQRRQLEEDVRQADTMVSRLRERLFPLIEKEIDKIKPN